MKHFETVLVEYPQEHTVLVTLNRPAVANAMNTQMGLDLLEVFDGFCAAPNKQRCIVVTGAGAKAFCAGGDLKQRNGMTDEQWQDQHLIFERMIRAMIACPVPVIAAVNGAAYAGGMEISLCADFIYAAEQARFALTEVTLGIMPGAGGTQNLPRAVGARRAKEILLTGRPFSVHGQPDLQTRNADRRSAGNRRGDRRQRADLDAADQAVGEHGTEYRFADRHDVRDRGVQPDGSHRRPS